MQRFTPQSSQDLTFDRLGDYLDGAASALLHRQSLAQLAPRWLTLRDRCDAAENRKKAARRLLNRARVGYWVADGEFDQTVRNLSTETFHQAGKDASAEPYVSIFGTHTADEVTTFGEEKATSFGRNTSRLADSVLAVITTDGARAAVQALLAELATQTTGLTAAGDAREEARTALDAFDIERRQLIRETIALIADTEVDILNVHRGRRDLVDRVLALDYDATNRKKKEAPTTPT